ncbi:MAG: glycosyltransferase [Alphaproteobacteria bacterium]|nr:glycosyltransferase [Alphaproteobacteria bacterium]MBU1516018.1 glycosyltransferase [Alphaproteobacteria bacterium]MBU2092767.1 glycosyltransferase [Alphaproteobacteria bacterium]MBU2153708.1 glycosyltransferase [Alphaproteobacteria bacterium]MBU2308336.1 glycosyltransferase [Alphaproteobacteria bacterium]
MSVLHLLGTAGEGGAETYFVDLVKALHRAGVAEAAAIRANPVRQARLRKAGVPVKVLRFGGPIDILTKPAAAGFATLQKTKVALAWMNRAARHTPRGPWARIGRLGGYYSLKYYKGFDHLVANTEDIADWIVDQGWPAGRVSCIPNFAAAPPNAGPVDRASLDTPADAPLLLAMGRLHENKAHDISLQALTQLPDAWLWIAGVGPLEAKLKGMAEALGVANRVRFLGWRTDASALYRTADVCVFPSRFEPLGNVVIQSWAHGLPVIAAASQGPKALIQDDADGLLVPVDDPDALAAGVRRLLAEPTLRARLAAAGGRRVDAEFSEAAVVAQWKALFADYGAG